MHDALIYSLKTAYPSTPRCSNRRGIRGSRHSGRQRGFSLGVNEVLSLDDVGLVFLLKDSLPLLLIVAGAPTAGIFAAVDPVSMLGIGFGD